MLRCREALQLSPQTRLEGCWGKPQAGPGSSLHTPRVGYGGKEPVSAPTAAPGLGSHPARRRGPLPSLVPAAQRVARGEATPARGAGPVALRPRHSQKPVGGRTAGGQCRRRDTSELPSSFPAPQPGQRDSVPHCGTSVLPRLTPGEAAGPASAETEPVDRAGAALTCCRRRSRGCSNSKSPHLTCSGFNGRQGAGAQHAGNYSSRGPPRAAEAAGIRVTGASSGPGRGAEPAAGVPGRSWRQCRRLPLQAARSLPRRRCSTACCCSTWWASSGGPAPGTPPLSAASPARPRARSRRWWRGPWRAAPSRRCWRAWEDLFWEARLVSSQLASTPTLGLIPRTHIARQLQKRSSKTWGSEAYPTQRTSPLWAPCSPALNAWWNLIVESQTGRIVLLVAASQEEQSASELG